MKTEIDLEINLEKILLSVSSKYLNIENFELDFSQEKIVELPLTKVKGVLIISKNLEDIEGLHLKDSDSKFSVSLDGSITKSLGFYFVSMDSDFISELKLISTNTIGKTYHKVFVYVD